MRTRSLSDLWPHRLAGELFRTQSTPPVELGEHQQLYKVRSWTGFALVVHLSLPYRSLTATGGELAEKASKNVLISAGVALCAIGWMLWKTEGTSYRYLRWRSPLALRRIAYAVALFGSTYLFATPIAALLNGNPLQFMVFAIAFIWLALFLASAFWLLGWNLFDCAQVHPMLGPSVASGTVVIATALDFAGGKTNGLPYATWTWMNVTGLVTTCALCVAEAYLLYSAGIRWTDGGLPPDSRAVHPEQEAGWQAPSDIELDTPLTELLPLSGRIHRANLGQAVVVAFTIERHLTTIRPPRQLPDIMFASGPVEVSSDNLDRFLGLIADTAYDQFINPAKVVIKRLSGPDRPVNGWRDLGEIAEWLRLLRTTGPRHAVLPPDDVTDRVASALTAFPDPRIWQGKSRGTTSVNRLIASRLANHLRLGPSTSAEDQVKRTMPSLQRLGIERMDTLCRSGKIDELRKLAAAGYDHAVRRLADLYYARGMVEELRVATRRGEPHAARRLLALEAKRNDIRRLRSLVAAGHPNARYHLGVVLARAERFEEALVLLRPFTDIDDTSIRTDGTTMNGSWRYVRLLGHLERFDELRALADAGHDMSAFYLERFR